MFRSLTAILLICTMITSNFTRLFVYAGFEMNQKYIASVLCENRDKPELHCNGKCYLRKKLQQAEEKEKKTERLSQKNHFQDAFITQKLRVKFPVQLICLLETKEEPFNLPQHATLIFHPPQA